MELIMGCMQCAENKTIEGDADRLGEEDLKIDLGVNINSKGYYILTCPRGHNFHFFLQNDISELLFEYALYALKDGYYRESIASFSSSLERFYEYYLKMCCRDFGVSLEHITNAWKKIKNQSERQLGAFIFLYTIKHSEPPPLLSQANVEFRNKVIHKGEFPSKQEAINFGQAVLDVIAPIITDIHNRIEKQEDTTSPVFFERSNEYLQALKDAQIEQEFRGYLIRTTLGIHYAVPEERIFNIEDALTRIEAEPVFRIK